MNTEEKDTYPKMGLAKLIVALICLIFLGFGTNVPGHEIIQVPILMQSILRGLVIIAGLIIILKTINNKRKALSIGTLSIVFWIIVSYSIQLVLSYLVWGNPNSDFKDTWIYVYRYKNILSELIGMSFAIIFGYAQVVGTLGIQK